MHELSIALALVDEATAVLLEHEPESAPVESMPTVRALTVRVGALSGVDPKALASAYLSARVGTPLASARLTIEPAPPRPWCVPCHLAAPPGAGECPGCHGPLVLRDSNELTLLRLEIDHGSSPAATDRRNANLG